MFTAVEVVVPQSRYNEFADGLARIGSWRLEAARFPLPDAVHMTIRVALVGSALPGRIAWAAALTKAQRDELTPDEIIAAHEEGQ